MHNLNSTSDIIRVVTGSAVSTIGVHASWADFIVGTITPGRTLTAITTAATTTVVASPAGATTRNVRGLILSNNSTSSCAVTVQHYDGTTSVDICPTLTLLSGERIEYGEDGHWSHFDANGGLYFSNASVLRNLGQTNVIGETIPRELCMEVNSTVPPASGTLWLQSIWLPAGVTISNILLWSATTAAGTPTNSLAGLYDNARNLLATSANATTTAWAANSQTTYAMTTPYKTKYAGLYYIGFFMTATTIITMKGTTARTASQLAGAAPILAGASNTGLTTALPNPANAPTASTASMYAAVS